MRENFVYANEGAHFPVNEGTGEGKTYVGWYSCPCLYNSMFPVRLSYISSSLKIHNPNKPGSSLFSEI